MNPKKIAVLAVLAAVVGAFFFGMQAYQRNAQAVQEQKTAQQSDRLVRMHSPVLGPQNAPVTIVEFFDPACETCRAFYPLVKQLMAQYPQEVRLVLRYAPFHQGSDQVIQLLEASKAQNRYWQVLESDEVRETAYLASVRLRLDPSQMPKTFQVSALSNRAWSQSSDWFRWTFTVPETSPSAAPADPGTGTGEGK